MTYAKAKMIIWNHETYPHETVRQAAIWMLGWLTAKPEDISQAASLL